jgi:hypothetical protein
MSQKITSIRGPPTNGTESCISIPLYTLQNVKALVEN